MTNSDIVEVETTENEVVVSDTGQPGPRGNSILNGTEVPTSTFPENAVEGDFYLKIPEYLLYGPRTFDGQWGDPVDLFTLPESFHLHVQNDPSTTWIIDHTLQFFPNVTVVNSAGDQVEGSVIYNNQNRVTIEFSTAFSGKAYLS